MKLFAELVSISIHALRGEGDSNNCQIILRELSNMHKICGDAVSGRESVVKKSIQIPFFSPKNRCEGPGDFLCAWGSHYRISVSSGRYASARP